MKQLRYYTGKTLSFFGIGVLYLLVCFPRPDRLQDGAKCKCGITGFHIGADKRAGQVSEALPGFWFPVFFCVIPFVYQVEQILHWLMEPLNCPFAAGSGRTETFWFPAHLIVACYISAFWIFEISAIEWALGVDLFCPCMGSIFGKINFAD